MSAKQKAPSLHKAQYYTIIIHSLRNRLYIAPEASYCATLAHGSRRSGIGLRSFGLRSLGLHSIARCRVAWLLSLTAFSGFYPATAHAYHLPLWEAGIGFGAIHAPHYRGSKSSKDYALPVPYLIYRGERLKADREGMRGKLFESERIKLNMSIAANVPVPSVTTGAREGMPGLDPVLEFGPALNIKLWHSQTNDTLLWFKVPLRAALSIGDPIVDYQGLVFSPYLQIAKTMHLKTTRWRFKFSTGPIFATQRYHDYFYRVDSGYVTDKRTEYHSTAGYSGSRFTVTVSRNSKRFYLGSFARYDNLSGATFEKSPLVETNDYLVFGVFFAWVFANSAIHPPHD
ncbi:MAG: MipA/OmpV family protein [Gammaproteobacteria bacterium]|nr:MipA/OmpV family protein [Gammaproteobacteria bacterium]